MPQATSATALNYLGAQQYQLSMEGRFDPGWICGLSHGLAERHRTRLLCPVGADTGIHLEVKRSARTEAGAACLSN
jgi:hypothetical protein